MRKKRYIVSKTIEERSFGFAVRIVKLKDYLIEEKKEFDISRQILRSGTSRGANVSEAQQAQSQADFLTKMNIALKEANETKFWLRLLRDCKYISDELAESLLLDCYRIIKILATIVGKVKLKIKNTK